MSRLDQLLTWLWRVHGVDYYAGTEVAEPDEEQRAGPRPTLRCPRPEEGEQVSCSYLTQTSSPLWRLAERCCAPYRGVASKSRMAEVMEHEGVAIKNDIAQWHCMVHHLSSVHTRVKRWPNRNHGSTCPGKQCTCLC